MNGIMKAVVISIVMLAGSAAAADICYESGNDIVCENGYAGTNYAEWKVGKRVTEAGDYVVACARVGANWVKVGEEEYDSHIKLFVYGAYITESITIVDNTGSETCDTSAGISVTRLPSAWFSSAQGMIEVRGYRGDDDLLGSYRLEYIYGGDGYDDIWGGGDDDHLYGEANDDYIEGEGGDDYISGGTGDDEIDGCSGVDTIDGNDGDDEIRGDSGNDVIDGGAGMDYIYGDSDDDVINGGDDTDHLYGGTGDDYIYGDGDRDWIWGEAGEDWLVGGYDWDDGDSMIDMIYGGDDEDVLWEDAGWCDGDDPSTYPGDECNCGGAGYETECESDA